MYILIILAAVAVVAYYYRASIKAWLDGFYTK
jgi:Flp pilus assembly pilin Flp